MERENYLYVAGGVFAAWIIFSQTDAGVETLGDYNFNKAANSVSSAVRGIRNNNPGNIVRSGINWQGMNANQTDATFVQFDSMFYGLRALSKNLLSYYRRGLNTVSEIITTWSATDQAAYVKSVSGYMGVAPDQIIDVSDIDTRISLMRAIIRFENGLIASALISDAAIYDGANAA